MSMRNNMFSWCLIFTSVLVCATAPNLFGIWVGMEVNLFGALWFLVNNKKSTVTAGFKYYFSQCFGSSLIIMGIVVAHWTANISVITLVMCGLGMKMGAAPFHFWVVEVLDSARPSCMWVILTINKFIPLYTMCNSGYTGGYLVGMSAMSALVGSICGMGAVRLSRFIGYSSISNTGWSLAACMLGPEVFLWFILAYWVSLGGFLSLMGGDGFLYCVSGGSVRRPPFSVGVCVWLLALGGFPPFAGFFAKAVVFIVIFEFIPWLGLFLAVSTTISWGYYLFVFSFSIICGSKSVYSKWSDRSMVVAPLMGVIYCKNALTFFM
uniref:NADH-ubiquinone oxidoreductase chain 2 n=1 Tax=Mimachlamys nobilis TaxID=106276 RepID=B7TYF6_MIMNO|nr:NADH dehydrogenase subunit 2 [Mimachlamys nobilis]ACJ64166.1 NADH dehydrogenase subunit 2 [Mimachlamys nobilis]